jgi:hypothetical protein
MKRLMFIIIFITSVQFVNAQVRFRTSDFCYRTESNGYWSQWSKWQSVDVLVNIVEDRVIIYSQQTQIYDVIQNLGKNTDNDGDTTYSFSCVDAEGIRCRVRLVSRADTSTLQLYVDYSDINWVYNLRAIPQ